MMGMVLRRRPQGPRRRSSRTLGLGHLGTCSAVPLPAEGRTQNTRLGLLSPRSPGYAVPQSLALRRWPGSGRMW